MTTVTASTAIAGNTQADGGSYVVETHLLSDGRTISYEYLAPAGLDIESVKVLRSAKIESTIQAREAAVGIVDASVVPLTKFEFRQLFAPTERAAIDAFNAGFEASGALSAEQKAAIRTNLEDYKASGAVYLNNPATIAGVQLYESLGLIAAGRAAEILGG